MGRRKFAQVTDELISKELPLEQLGMAVEVQWAAVSHYFLALDQDPDGPGLTAEDLETIPLNSRALFAITRRQRIDAARKQLEKLAVMLGFEVRYEGDKTLVIWRNWWKKQGLKPRIHDEPPTDPGPIPGDLEHERKGSLEGNRNRTASGSPDSPPNSPGHTRGRTFEERKQNMQALALRLVGEGAVALYEDEDDEAGALRVRDGLKKLDASEHPDAGELAELANLSQWLELDDRAHELMHTFAEQNGVPEDPPEALEALEPPHEAPRGRRREGTFSRARAARD